MIGPGRPELLDLVLVGLFVVVIVWVLARRKKAAKPPEDDTGW